LTDQLIIEIILLNGRSSFFRFVHLCSGEIGFEVGAIYVV